MSESKQFLNIIRIFDPDQQTELIEIMKQYNFDEIIERRGTNCVKYDLLKKDFGNENLVPVGSRHGFPDTRLYCQRNQEASGA